jgi:hypothetical protein
MKYEEMEEGYIGMKARKSNRTETNQLNSTRLQTPLTFLSQCTIAKKSIARSFHVDTAE